MSTMKERLRLLAFSAALYLLIIWVPVPANAFGAGNIASISGLEGKAFRHGDIEDCIKALVLTKGAISLLSKKFSAMDVKRIYFGNWLRDYSQAIDVGTVGRGIPLTTLLTLLSVLGFTAHNYATDEFEVTEERLGCYRPEEHIDNPKGYADNQDARRHHPGLRGPVDARELEIDPRTGMKNYIANEQGGWSTSSVYVRKSLQGSVDQYRAGNHHEALRLLGQALHTLEDFPAHSNFVELSLIALGHENVYPFVGEDTAFRAVNQKPIFPIVTGTFGGSDFVHSLLGEATDHMSSASVTGLEKGIEDAKRTASGDSSLVELLDKAPGLGDMAREVEGADRSQVDMSDPAQIKDRIWSLLVLRDKVVKAVELTVANIPGLSWLAEKISESVQLFILTRLEVFVKPLMKQVVANLDAGSAALVSSEQQQEVFNNRRCSDPTHSLLSKDHFALYLNEPAGKVAVVIVTEVVNAVTQAWSSNDDQSTQHALNTAMEVFFHPADLGVGKTPFQQRMLDVIRTWASENPSLIRFLDKENVRAGRNRKGGEGGISCGGNYSGGSGAQSGTGTYVPTPSKYNSQPPKRREHDGGNEEQSHFQGFAGGGQEYPNPTQQQYQNYQGSQQQSHGYPGRHTGPHSGQGQGYPGGDQPQRPGYPGGYQQVQEGGYGATFTPPQVVPGVGGFPQPEIQQPNYGRPGVPGFSQGYGQPEKQQPAYDVYQPQQIPQAFPQGYGQPGIQQNTHGVYPPQQVPQGNTGYQQPLRFPDPNVPIYGRDDEGHHNHHNSGKHHHEDRHNHHNSGKHHHEDRHSNFSGYPGNY